MSRIRVSLMTVQLALTIQLVAYGGAPAPVLAATTLKVLPITMQVQEQSKWCWAAAGATIAAYHGVNVSQNKFCNLGNGYPSNSTCPNEAGSAARVQDALDALWFYSPGTELSAISYAGVKTQINANRPFYAGVSWTAGGGHALVVYGYFMNSVQPDAIYYANPWGTSQRYNLRSYQYFKSNKSWTWTKTLNNIKLLP